MLTELVPGNARSAFITQRDVRLHVHVSGKDVEIETFVVQFPDVKSPSANARRASAITSMLGRNMDVTILDMIADTEPLMESASCWEKPQQDEVAQHDKCAEKRAEEAVDAVANAAADVDACEIDMEEVEVMDEGDVLANASADASSTSAV
eukprot:Opistho-1_new@62894